MGKNIHRMVPDAATAHAIARSEFPRIRVRKQYKGMRIKGVSPVQDVPELKAPGDACIEHAMLAAEKYIPAGGR